jgi:hypothetical protein
VPCILTLPCPAKLSHRSILMFFKVHTYPTLIIIYRFIMVHRWFDLSKKAWVQMSARCSSSGVVCPSVPKNFSRQAEMETTTEKLKHQKCEETSWNIRKRKDTLQLPVVPIHACRSP